MSGKNSACAPINRAETSGAGATLVRVPYLKKGPRNEYLIIADHQYGECRIPLGEKLPTCAKGTHDNVAKGAAKNAVAVFIPAVFTTPDASRKNAASPAEGTWIYIFRAGKLWRELAVGREGSLSDVNLAEYFKKANGGPLDDKRKPTGVCEDSIVVPCKVNGAPQTIEVAVAHVQWSDAYIARLQANASERAKRMQTIDFTGYATGFAGSKNLADIDGADTPNISWSVHYKNTGMAVAYLQDPIEIANRLERKLTDTWGTLQGLVASLATGAQPFVNEANPPNKEEQAKVSALHRLATLMYQVGYANEDNKKRYGDDLNKDLLKTLLAVEERKEKRKDLQTFTEQLAKHLATDAYQTTMWDYLNNTHDRILTGKTLVTRHQRWLCRTPYALDRHLDIAEDRPEDQIGTQAASYLEDTLQARNYAGALLAATITVNGGPDTWSKWGEAFYTLVDTYAHLPLADAKFLPMYTIMLNSVQGRGIPYLEAKKIDHKFTPPKGYRPIPGALRKEIVEFAGQQEIRTTTDTPQAKQALAKAGLPTASGVATVTATARHVVILPDVAHLEKVFTTDQLVVKENKSAQAADAVLRARWFNSGFMGGIVALDIFNISLANRQLEKQNVSIKDRINLAGAIVGAGDTVANLVKFQAEVAGKKNVERLALNASRVLGGAAWFATGIMAWMDASARFDEKDVDAGRAYAAAGFLSVGVGIAAAMNASGFLIIPGIILTIALLVTAAYLTDDPLEKFAKNGPFGVDVALPSGGALWSTLRQVANQPTVGRVFKDKWTSWTVMTADILDYLYTFGIEVYVERQGSKNPEDNKWYSPVIAQVSHATVVKIVLPVRHFHRSRSQFELLPLRVYPKGIRGSYESVGLSKMDYSEDPKTGLVTKLHLVYDLSTVKSVQTDRAEMVVLARLLLEPESAFYIPQPSSKAEPRYLAARAALTNVRYPLATANEGGGAAAALAPEIYGKDRQVGTMKELEDPTGWRG